MKQLKITWQERTTFELKEARDDGNSQHCEFKKLEDETISHYLRKMGMLSRVAKRKKKIIRTTISSITL